MRDISDWIFLGHGEMSTLEKEDLRSPEGSVYVMKYPRPFDGERVNWEDINEVIAAQIAKLLNLPHMDAEIAYRNNQRGCLMKHFVEHLSVDYGEVGAALLTAQFGERYLILQNNDSLKNKELILASFKMFEEFYYFDEIKYNFIAMNLFDILIGNQDRHPYNWQLLFKSEKVLFAPLYDNGASLGWQLSDSKLNELLNNIEKMNSFFKKTELKVGLIEDKNPPLKMLDVLKYFIQFYPDETNKFVNNFKGFDWNTYSKFINEFPLISNVRKAFLKEFVSFRMNKLIELIK